MTGSGCRAKMMVTLASVVCLSPTNNNTLVSP